MRDPPRKAVCALLALAAAAASILWGIDRYEKPGGGDWTAAAPIMLGLAVAPFALYFLIEALLASVGRARLLRGERLIARWHVGAADWDRFRGIDSERLAGDVDLNNDLWIRKETPPEGIEVIVGEKSLIVDGSYHWLSTGGLPALRDARWIEGCPPASNLPFAIRRAVTAPPSGRP